MKKYRFALRELLNDLGKTPVQGFHAYFEGRLTRQAVYNICRKPPKVVYVETQDIICDALGVTPSDLWRETK